MLYIATLAICSCLAPFDVNQCFFKAWLATRSCSLAALLLLAVRHRGYLDSFRDEISKTFRRCGVPAWHDQEAELRTGSQVSAQSSPDANKSVNSAGTETDTKGHNLDQGLASLLCRQVLNRASVGLRWLNRMFSVARVSEHVEIGKTVLQAYNAPASIRDKPQEKPEREQGSANGHRTYGSIKSMRFLVLDHLGSGSSSEILKVGLCQDSEDASEGSKEKTGAGANVATTNNVVDQIIIAGGPSTLKMFRPDWGAEYLEAEYAIHCKLRGARNVLIADDFLYIPDWIVDPLTQRNKDNPKKEKSISRESNASQKKSDETMAMLMKLASRGEVLDLIFDFMQRHFPNFEQVAKHDANSLVPGGSNVTVLPDFTSSPLSSRERLLIVKHVLKSLLSGLQELHAYHDFREMPGNPTSEPSSNPIVHADLKFENMLALTPEDAGVTREEFEDRRAKQVFGTAVVKSAESEGSEHISTLLSVEPLFASVLMISDLGLANHEGHEVDWDFVSANYRPPEGWKTAHKNLEEDGKQNAGQSIHAVGKYHRGTDVWIFGLMAVEIFRQLVDGQSEDFLERYFAAKSEFGPKYFSPDARVRPPTVFIHETADAGKVSEDLVLGRMETEWFQPAQEAHAQRLKRLFAKQDLETPASDMAQLARQAVELDYIQRKRAEMYEMAKKCVKNAADSRPSVQVLQDDRFFQD